MEAVALEDFRALARSSPWMWQTMAFELRTRGGSWVYPPALRAWIRRPFGVRVEDPSGRPIMTAWQAPASSGLPEPTRPRLRADGLVAELPGDPGEPYRYDDPMFQSYQWVAMLNPYELADGAEVDGEGTLGQWSPGRSPIAAAQPLREVDHHGRPAWEAVASTTSWYASRCSCCPLLGGEDAERRMRAEGFTASGRSLPTRWRIRLDRATGVVCELADLDGDRSGRGWTMTIDEVDADLPRSMFDQVG